MEIKQAISNIFDRIDLGAEDMRALMQQHLQCLHRQRLYGRSGRRARGQARHSRHVIPLGQRGRTGSPGGEPGHTAGTGRGLHRRNRRLRQLIPEPRTMVAKSGIHERGEVERWQRSGAQVFLVDEAFVRAADPGSALQSLFHTQRKEANDD